LVLLLRLPLCKPLVEVMVPNQLVALVARVARVAVVLEAVEEPNNRTLPWHTTRRLNSPQCGTTAPRTRRDRTLNNKQLPARLRAAMVKYNVRLQTTIGNLAGQVGQAQAAAAAASAAPANAHDVAQAAGNANRFRLAAPPKYENRKNRDADIRHGCL
jgi:hypothetical protein